MSNLNLGNLKRHRNDILRAEVASYIALWDKIDPSNINKASININHKTLNDWEDILNRINIKFLNQTSINLWENFIKEWRGWRKEDNIENILKVLYGIGESLNSGIDKGSPSENIKVQPKNQRWISNAFGSYNGKIIYLEKDEQTFNNKINSIKDLINLSLNSPSISNIENLKRELKDFLSYLLSDDRFPINDVTLWDQTYMASSMFKALCSSYILSNQTIHSLPSRDKSRWRILAIQYDKLGLAEKGLKAASIKWYRDKTKEVDNKIKEILEIDYPIGNEVYRDETGIYFVVSENLIGYKDGDFYKLHNDLNELKTKIQDIFTNKFEGEIYPTIFLTEPSRGLMNLGHLIDKAKENFLKAEIPNDFKDNLEKQFDKQPQGICQICKLRLANKKNKDNLICDVCNGRIKGRIDNWLENPSDETIWLDELQDKNGKIALVTLKFEMKEWLNGDLLNTFLIQDELFFDRLKEISNFIKLFLSNQQFNVDASKIEDKIKELQNKLKSSTLTEEREKYGGEIAKWSSLKKEIEELKNLIMNVKKINWWEKQLKNDLPISGYTYTGNDIEKMFDEILKKYNNKIKQNFKKDVLETISFFPKELSKDAYNGCKKSKETFNDYIRQVFFGSIIGSNWKKFIKTHPITSKIDWDNEIIQWQNLTDADIVFLSELILQFLLRKNPSPARLRRIWETTKEFFENLENRIVELAEIGKERRKRLVWTGIDVDDGEYQEADILFRAKNKTIYLITSIEKIDEKKQFVINNKLLKREDADKQEYKPYFTILSPTPISWQFIIPAGNMPVLIKNIQEKYYKNFKWVYGKLPLHIGVIIQNYKRPLYTGIKALRKIRRNNQKWRDLRIPISAKDFKARQKKAFHYQEPPEQTSDCENFYSLFEKTEGEGKYQFYLYSETGDKKWIDTIRERQQIYTTQDSTDTEKFFFYPNTFDFEFMDTNTRRNDIFYKSAKRLMKIKNNRPYDIDSWQYFEKFKEFFKDKSSQLQKLVSLIYSKMEDWEGYEDSFQKFMLSSFINILDLKTDKKKNGFAKILGKEDFEKFEKMDGHKFKQKMLMFIDMFEFWHTALKEKEV